MVLKKTFHSVFLLALITFKVTVPHVYAHGGDNSHIEECELCVHAIQNQSIEFTVPVGVNALGNVLVPVAVPASNAIKAVKAPNFFYTFSFSRPPPTI